MSSRFDILLFGVSGQTGQFALEYLQKFSLEHKFEYGVAGRNQKKIQEVLDKVARETGNKSFSSIPILYGDMLDKDSLVKMTSKTKILINACGPLTGIGEEVVEACIETKTHYFDISAEENFIGKVLIKYSEMAKAAGVYIVNACGLNSLSYEMGMIFLQNNFPGTLNSVETYMKTGNIDPEMPTYTGNSSTFNSVINLQMHKGELKEIRKQIEKSDSSHLKPNLPVRKLPFHQKNESGWALHLASTDKAIMSRTQDYLHKIGKISRRTQIENYIMFETLWFFPQFIFLGILFIILVQFEAGRRLLMKFPTFFSGGLFSKDHVPRKMLENKWIRIIFIGKGWKGRKVDENCKDKPDYGMKIELKGINPSYGITALCLVAPAVILTTEASKITKEPGVCMPGAVFHGTSIIDLLNNNGLSFSIIDEFAL